MRARLVFCTTVVLGSVSWSVDGATLYLSNPTPDTDETSGSMSLVSNESGTMNIMLDTAAIDPNAVAFLYSFLDALGPCDVKVTDVVHGQGPPFEYFDSTYTLPTELSFPCDDGDGVVNEYRLEFGDPTFDGGFPLGSASYLIDSLTLTHTRRDGRIG